MCPESTPCPPLALSLSLALALCLFVSLCVLPPSLFSLLPGDMLVVENGHRISDLSEGIQVFDWMCPIIAL